MSFWQNKLELDTATATVKKCVEAAKDTDTYADTDTNTLTTHFQFSAQEEQQKERERKGRREVERGADTHLAAIK